jgi:PBP1b-binding outer membrane lipoprotein LpoB
LLIDNYKKQQLQVQEAQKMLDDLQQQQEHTAANLEKISTFHTMLAKRFSILLRLISNLHHQFVFSSFT